VIIRQILHDKKNCGTCTNTDGWGNKLVTIFARYLDSFIVTIKSLIIYKNRDFGSGQILHLDSFLVRRDGKNCAIPSLHRDSFLAYRDRFVAVLSSGNAH